MPLWATMVLMAKSTGAAVVREVEVAAVRPSLKIKLMINYISSHCLRQEVANGTPVAHHVPDAGARDVHQGGFLEDHFMAGQGAESLASVSRGRSRGWTSPRSTSCSRRRSYPGRSKTTKWLKVNRSL